jgi:ribosomal protein S18 acetylase RimI-like enzyme
MQIRSATSADLELLRNFAERTFRIAYEADNDPVTFEEYCRQAFTLEQFQMEMEHPFSAFWLGWDDGQLVAYLKLNFDNHPESLMTTHSVQVERLYIEPTWQNNGLGAMALDFAIDQAKKNDAEWIWLSVWKKNPSAVRFYERCGFKILGTEIFYVADDPQVDWLMGKPV